jgi:5-enolpyruvylshikimate-3-phosphate synthase
VGEVSQRINDPGFVRKTFPDYFADFARNARPARAI